MREPPRVPQPKVYTATAEKRPRSVVRVIRRLRPRRNQVKYARGRQNIRNLPRLSGVAGPPRLSGVARQLRDCLLFHARRRSAAGAEELGCRRGGARGNRKKGKTNSQELGCEKMASQTQGLQFMARGNSGQSGKNGRRD